MSDTFGHYRSIFISDLHLGSRASRAYEVCDFLKNHSSDHLFLIGDIIDGWRLKSSWFFPQDHTAVIRRILKAAKRCESVYYIPGNHDDFLRKYIEGSMVTLGNICIIDQYVYESKEGRRYLVIHGDQFDGLMLNAKWIMHVGDILYSAVVWVNVHLNRFRKLLGMEYWSLSGFLKYRTKQAVKYIQQYEHHLIDYCKKRSYDGVICGHIHAPEIRVIDGIEYMNDGDFCDSCTAIVETMEGEFKLIRLDKSGWVFAS